MNPIQYRNFTIRMIRDEDPMNPRTEYYNVTKMVLFHRRYRLGDKSNYRSGDFKGWGNLKDVIVRDEKPAIIKPVYMYDHSGITIKTSPFGCPWDSGQIGYVWITKEMAKKELGVTRMTKKAAERLDTFLEAGVKAYDNYLTGSIFCWQVVNQAGDVEESVGGYSQDDFNSGYAIQEAQACIDRLVSETEELA